MGLKAAHFSPPGTALSRRARKAVTDATRLNQEAQIALGRACYVLLVGEGLPPRRVGSLLGITAALAKEYAESYEDWRDGCDATVRLKEPAVPYWEFRKTLNA